MYMTENNVQTFGFLIHPISAKKDISRKFPIAKIFPERCLESVLKHISPMYISNIEGITSITGEKAEGYFIGCPLVPRQFLELPDRFVMDKIIASVNMAAEHGAKIVGLGAYTSVAGDGGVTIDKETDVAITTGNSYTCYSAVQGSTQAAELLGVPIQNARVAIIGATGSIGRVAAHLIASDGVGELTLIGRNEERLSLVADEVKGDIKAKISTDIDDVLPAMDIVITVTSSVDAVIEPRHLKRGAIVCDVSRPRDVSVKVAKERDDVLVIEGGVISVPGDVDFHFNFGFPPKTSYACMAETMILALENRYESYSLGKELSLEKVREIGKLANKHGFKLSGFRSFEKAVQLTDIDRIREKLKS